MLRPFTKRLQSGSVPTCPGQCQRTFQKIKQHTVMHTHTHTHTRTHTRTHTHCCSMYAMHEAQRGCSKQNGCNNTRKAYSQSFSDVTAYNSMWRRVEVEVVAGGVD